MVELAEHLETYAKRTRIVNLQNTAIFHLANANKDINLESVVVHQSHVCSISHVVKLRWISE